ncbi:uncharacterized protein LOC121922304 [Sceloporus undulatus]|uniref:uncharacterized protein LOC121922304 n=1 Tax=Sceloporus undulatus TaxID=8520 RepID=UPI001C4DAACC|nr:uncharacterized protein LOC121922304 [Sceloporus undulatus]
MSRKRRRSCKGRKSSDTRENEHLPIFCRCQQNADAENRAGENPSKTNLSDVMDITETDKNRNSCTVTSEEKNVSDVFQNQEQDNTCDSAKEGKQEKDCSLLGFSGLQDNVLADVNTDESETTLTGNANQEQTSETVHSFQSDNAFVAEVKCGSFNVKVEVKKNELFNTGAEYVAGKWRHHKKRRCRKDHCCKLQKVSNIPTDFSGKYDQPSKCTIQIANDQNPSVKLTVVGKEIRIKCSNRKQKLTVSILPGDEPKKCGQVSRSNYGNEFASDASYSTTEASFHSDFESDFSFQEKEESFTSYISPECCALIPPPLEFADPEEICATEVVSLSLAGDKNVSDTLSVALNCDGRGDLYQEKNSEMMESANGKDFFKDMFFSEFSYTEESPKEDHSCREIHFRNKPNEGMTDVHQIRNNSLVDTRNIMVVSHLEANTIRRYSFPATSVDILSSFPPRRDSGFYSMPSLALKVLPKPNKSLNNCNQSHHATISSTELSSSFTSLLSNLRDLKSSYSYGFTSYDHDMTVYHAELEEKLNSAFFMDHCFEFMEDYEEMDQVVVEDFHSIANSIREEKEKHRPCEPLGRLDICEEYTELAKGGLDDEVVGTNHHKVQAYVELENKAPVCQAALVSRHPSSTSTDHNNISSKDTIDGIQSEHSVLQPDGNESEGTKKKQRRSVMTVITGQLERRLIIRADSKTIADSLDVTMKKEPILPCSIRESFMSPLLDADEPELDDEFQSFTEVQEMSEIIHRHSIHEDISAQTNSVSNNLEDEHNLISTFTEAPEMVFSSQDICVSSDCETHLAEDEVPELLKPSCEDLEIQREINVDIGQNPGPLSPKIQVKQLVTALEDMSITLTNDQVSRDERADECPQEEPVDRWALRRKQFKNSKRCSSAGGSSINSTLTEGSINSEDGRSLDLGLRSESEERGFYTEIFHSMSWVFRGDDASPNNSPRCLSKRPRPVAVRERTVRIAKGTGDYPWGFRIQFSKPILVTEVDTNSAAEEAGLQIGDIVMAVNGTDVTSMPHSEAASLARKGPDILTLLVGSDISRCPNTPRPTCRGYLHKRTQSSILKGWRKRWFVLKHDGCLYYYKHKKDEGKCRPLEVTKLEGAEIGMDSSLGKPFVFKCVPQTGNRIFYFCATSNQEMKRWLEAMEKAVHPVHQNHVWVDVTMHNTSLPPLAIKNPECLGLLHQLDKNKDMWVQHYCILKDGCLYFYASIRSTHALGGIYLQGYTVSEQALGSRRSVIEVKPPSEEFKTFYLCAESLNENKRWINALRASASKWLPLNKAIQDFMNRPLEETRM